MEFLCWQVTVMRVSYLLQKGLCHLYSIHTSLPRLPPRPCLLCQAQPVTLLHTLGSIYKVFYLSQFIYFSKSIYCEFASTRSSSFDTYCRCLFLAERLPNIIAETPSSCQKAGQKDTGRHRERCVEEVLDLM